jgi:hypothetical protein
VAAAVNRAPEENAVYLTWTGAVRRGKGGCWRELQPWLGGARRGGQRTYKRHHEEKGSMFFFEKKNQKTFINCDWHCVHPVGRRLAAIVKSFLVLFFKKEQLPSCLC